MQSQKKEEEKEKKRAKLFTPNVTNKLPKTGSRSAPGNKMISSMRISF